MDPLIILHKLIHGIVFSWYPSKDDLLKAYGPLLIETIIAKHTLARYTYRRFIIQIKVYV